ncbi:MAG: hypothetical protein IKH14_09775, partial [Prevotella sp.]|nr:hypothetical protein [Prevotella sp.]
MMKKVFLLLLTLVPSMLEGQTLKPEGASAEEVLPEGWTSSHAYGDLNKDGIKDMVLIALPPRRNMAPKLAVYWGKGGDRYVR